MRVRQPPEIPRNADVDEILKVGCIFRSLKMYHATKGTININSRKYSGFANVILSMFYRCVFGV